VEHVEQHDLRWPAERPRPHSSRREARRQQWRFRRAPVTYLKKLEELAIQLGLLS
jgi:hypothetical protein